ncbi:5-deoxy-glucuronate isomerase, partial [Streptomyces globisporus]
MTTDHPDQEQHQDQEQHRDQEQHPGQGQHRDRNQDQEQHRFHLPSGSAARGAYAVDIDPEGAGWDRSALRVLELEPGGVHPLVTGDSEWIVLPLAGGCTVRIAGETFELRGRESVFSGVSDFAYVPRDARAEISSGAGGRFALAGAKCERRLPARYGPAPEVPVEL